MRKIRIDKPYIPSDKIVTRFIEDDLIIVPIQTDTIDFDHSIYSMTPTGIVIWKMLKPDATIADICKELATKYDTSYEIILKDSISILQELLDKELIVQIP